MRTPEPAPVPRLRAVSMRSVRTAALLLLVAAASPAAPRWTRLGGTGVSAGLAGPAGRPVEGVWFSADGGRLYASLQDGSLWASGDAGWTWNLATGRPLEPRAVMDRDDDVGSFTVLRNPYRVGVSYALGEHLYRSDDGGGEWINLTADGDDSIIGKWQALLAVSPSDPDLLVVGNSMGLWKSHDSGATWASLNARLPNFPEVRFRSFAASNVPRLTSVQLGLLELVRTPAGPAWTVSPGSMPRSGDRVPQAPGQADPGGVPPLPPGTGALWSDCAPTPACSSPTVTARASNGQLWAGTSDGHIWVSRGEREAWSLSWSDPESREIARIWADPALPRTALALAGGRILRSTNGGTSWYDITSDLPDAEWTALVGHPSGDAAYVGGPLGVYLARTDLRQPGPAGPWIRISDGLPASAVNDLTLQPLRGRLYVAVPGHGVYWTRTPEVEQALRVVSAADLTQRAAAPGSLLTVLGSGALRVRLDGHPAPVLDSADGQLQVQVPFAVQGRSVRLQLDLDGSRHVVDMPLKRVAPAVFVVGGEPLILDAGTGALVGWHRPAVPGGSVLVMATGLGEVEPDWPTGVPSPETDPPRPVARIRARIGGLPAEVVSSYLAGGYVGIYVVEVAVQPNTLPGVAQLTLEADGEPSNRVPLVIGR